MFVVLTHLSLRWDYISSLYESGKLEEETGSESQEVLEDILVRTLTREYLEVLKVRNILLINILGLVSKQNRLILA